MTSQAVAQQLQQLTELGSPSAHNTETEDEVIARLDAEFMSWEDLIAAPKAGDVEGSSSTLAKLELEKERWQNEQDDAERELADISSRLPGVIASTRSSLDNILTSAQSLALERYALADEISALIQDVFGNEDLQRELDDISEGKETVPRKTLLMQLETLQDRLEQLDMARQWAAVLERIMDLSQATLAPASVASSSTSSSHPALSGLPPFRQLHSLVEDMVKSLPASLFLVDIAKKVRDETWQGVRSALSDRLLKATEDIGWPKKVEYHSIPADKRKEFEVAFRELLSLQAEAEKMGLEFQSADPAKPSGLYPIETMIQPVALRFRFHFEGTRGTNRLDKPEWAFNHILDLIFEHRHFAEDYLQPLISRGGFPEVDAMSELMHQLLPLPLALLKHRFPHLLDHPALLAHTVYQTVVFDEAIRTDEFDLNRTWTGVRQRRRGDTKEPLEWSGLAEQVLSTSDWYERWLRGEKQFTDDQFNEIISSPDSWTIADPDTLVDDDEEQPQSALRPTVGARQVQALLEQVTDRYTSLPSVKYKLPFLARIQFPILEAFQGRLTSSLDAFETLSSSFLRAVPGALAGHAGHNGLSVEQGQMTSGTGGLQRLCKAWVSAAWMQETLTRWDDEPHFVEFLAQIKADPTSLRQARALESMHVVGSSIFDVMADRFGKLAARAEDLMVRHVSSEVERDLKAHLTRRWDTPTDPADGGLEWLPGTSLVTAMSALSSHLSHLARTLPHNDLNRLYRLIIAHLSNHVLQRAVYSGWSKYTEVGGRELAAEVEAWIEACLIGLDGKLRKPEAPWRELRDAATILSLPKEPPGDGRPSFSQAMALAFGDDVERLKDRLGLTVLDDQKVRAVMRRRIECWR